jgi:hypothetical protein
MRQVCNERRMMCSRAVRSDQAKSWLVDLIMTVLLKILIAVRLRPRTPSIKGLEFNGHYVMKGFRRVVNTMGFFIQEHRHQLA